jgi:hypothetical protein
MSNIFRIFGLIYFCFLVVPITGLSQNNGKFANAGFDDDSIFISYYSCFQKAIRNNDSVYISQQVYYPFTVLLGKNKKLKLKSDKEFLTNYRKIINKQIKDLILIQSAKDLFVSMRGVMVGRGQLWFEYIEDEKGSRIILSSISNFD